MIVRLSSLLLALAALAALAACRPDSNPPPPSSAASGPKVTKPTPPRLDGEIFVADARKRVAPFVMHAPQMDLFVACRMLQDEERKKGVEDPSLCYDPQRRTSFARLRVEHTGSLTAGNSIGHLRERGEGAHFLVERTGSMYQLLDLAHAARRGGALRGGEVRILSGSDEGAALLVDAILSLYPDLDVQHVTWPVAEPDAALPTEP